MAQPLLNGGKRICRGELAMKVFWILIINISLVGVAQAQPQSHAYIHSMKSTAFTHYYFGVGLDGEVSKAKQRVGEAEDLKQSSWQGHGIRNTLGFEMIRFLQFEVAHSNIELKSTNQEKLSGSRFHGGANLSFAGPLGNILFGGGAIAGKYDYARLSESAGFVGTGYYYNIGYNYYLNTSVSFNAHLQNLDENIVRNSGSEELRSLQAEGTLVGMGFRIWM
jgi:hypothetical protein